MAVANDPVTGRHMQRSFTVHGHSELIEARRRALVGRFGVDRRALYGEGARWSVAELLERFLAANPHWRPATRSSNTSVARFLIGDASGRLGLAALSPAMRSLRTTGASESSGDRCVPEPVIDV